MIDRIGERLRRRREELGFTVGDIAEATRFRPEIIRAVEEGRAGVFPAEAYLKAFLRAYAVRLDIDPDEIVRDQRSEEERAQDAIRGLRLGPHRDLNLRKAFALLGIAAATVVAIVFISRRLLRRPDTQEATPGEVPPEPSTVADSLHPGSAGERREIEEGATEESEHSSGSSGSTEDRSGRGAPAASETDTERATTMSGVERVDEPRGADVRPVASGGGEASKQNTEGLAAGGVSELEIVVERRSAVVRLRSGDRVLVDDMLRPGYRKTFRSSEPFVVDYLTDRDAVVLLLDGEPVVFPVPPDQNDKAISEFTIPFRQ